jgi:ABC-type antimicrobial peptide transport system permease subunit
MVRYDNEHDMQVTAVVQDVPKNSTITFDYLVPFSFIFEVYPFWKSNSISWEYDFMMTMVELKEGVTMEAFSKKIGPLNTLRNPKAQNQTLLLHPLKKWHLRNDYKNWVNTGGKIEYVQLFAVTGIFVLLIACFNFMNLATARSQKRAREVGVRKALGSQRLQLIMQFLTESIFIAFLAFLLSLLLVQLLQLLLKNIGFDNIYFDLTNISLIASALLVTAITGLVAGSYPALYLSSFAPVKVLKGAFRQGKGTVNFRKVLVVSQFVISICLIIGTTIVLRQINHAKNRSIGYDKNNLVSIYTSGDLGENFNALKQDLLNSGYIESVAKASQPMTEIYGTESNFSWEGKDPNNSVALNVILTEWDFEKTVGLKFKQGRPFSRSYKTDSEAVLLNEAALKIIGYKDPLGKTIKIGDKVRTIVGIVEDVIVADPFKRPLPSAILFHSGLTDNVANIFLRLKPTSNVSKSMAAVDGIINKYNPTLPSEYSFVDEEFEKKFTTENQVVKLAGIFAGFAIFISCLGLIGLAAFMAERRTKEIGIRKVLGASVVSLWILLSKEFIWLVFLACLIASPLSLWLMNDWLQNYEYRINIGWAVFAIASFLAIGIALFTVSTQVFKSALINPLKSLRRE